MGAIGRRFAAGRNGMTRSNRGSTSLKRRKRVGNSMQDYDQLPAELRAWLSRAILPWRPRSVRKAFERALASTHDRQLALQRLDQIEEQMIAKDARTVWGDDHPATTL
ncbi:MAG: DUF6525 family protein [Pseudomonadota bacterium]